MSMYRCAVCGSPNVKRIDQNDGFSYKKAAVGTAVFGTIGAVAGINGKQKTMYDCPDCGNQSAIPMDDLNKNLVDTLMMLPANIIEKTNSDLLIRYSYLRKEIAQKRGNISTAVQDNYNGMVMPSNNNPFDISENEFREAAKLFYNTMVGFNGMNAPTVVFKNGNYYWTGDEFAFRDSPFVPRPMNEYISAYNALPTIYHGVPAFSHLLYDDVTETGNGLSRFYIGLAVVFYIFVRHGDMSYYDLYQLAQSDRFMGKVLDIALWSKYKRDSMNGLWEPWNVWARNHRIACADTLINMTATERFGNMQNNNRTVLSPKLHLINGSLYTKGVSKEEQYRAEHPDIEESLRDISNKIQSFQAEITKVKNASDPSNIAEIKKQISAIDRNVSKTYKDIELLRKKIFGRTKAKQEVNNLEKNIEEWNDEKNELQKKLKFAIEQENHEKEMHIESLNKEIKKADEKKQEIEKEKRELLSTYSDLVCYYGPDATVTPLNNKKSMEDLKKEMQDILSKPLFG